MQRFGTAEPPLAEAACQFSETCDIDKKNSGLDAVRRGDERRFFKDADPAGFILSAGTAPIPSNFSV